MHNLLIALLAFALGLGGAVLVASPGAGAHTSTVDGTITGGVADGHANASLISLSVTSVVEGTYEFDISDGSSMHNFDICKGSNRCTNVTSLDKTSISGSGDAVWDIELTPGTYTYNCDAHAVMTKHFTVTSSSTTSTTDTTQTSTTQTTTTTPAKLTVRIRSTHASRSLVKVSASASELSRVSAVLLRKGKRLARAAADGTKVSLRLKPSKALAPGRYVVKVTVKCCGTSASATKTIRVR